MQGFWTGKDKMKLGIVGLPNVGKSTLFNSLTKAGAESANYPFCTIDPNVGVVPVPDKRLKLLGDLYHSKKVTQAVLFRFILIIRVLGKVGSGNRRLPLCGRRVFSRKGSGEVI